MRKSQQRAFAMIAVLFSMVISVVLGSVYSAHVMSQVREARLHEYSSQSEYLAMTGLQYGIHLMRTTSNPETAMTPPASARVVLQLDGDRVGTAVVRWDPVTGLLSSDGSVTRSDGRLLAQRRLRGTVGGRVVNILGGTRVTDYSRVGITELHVAP